MAEEKIACDVCHRPILGCTCGEPEIAPFVNPLDTNTK